MKLLLFKNFNPENVRIQVAPELAISWSWLSCEGIGDIPVDVSEEALLTSLRERNPRILLYLTSDGRIGNRLQPWLQVEPDDDLMVLLGNLHVVRQIHERLLGYYAKVDRAAVLANWRKGHSDRQDTELDEAVAISTALDALPTDLEEGSDESEGERSASQVARPKPRVPHIRGLKFFSILTKHFGCTVSSAQGSEKKVYRPGGLIYRLGWHEKDKVLYPRDVKMALRKLGIPVEDFLAELT